LAEAAAIVTAEARVKGEGVVMAALVAAAAAAVAAATAATAATMLVDGGGVMASLPRQ
jgi:hypothetical protein